MLSYLYNFVCTSSFSIFRILHGQIIVWNLKLSCKTAKLLSKLPFKSQQIAVQKSWSKCSGSRRKSIWKETFPNSFINFKTSECELDEILFELSIKLVCLKWNQPGESFFCIKPSYMDFIAEKESILLLYIPFCGPSLWPKFAAKIHFHARIGALDWMVNRRMSLNIKYFFLA